MKFVELDDVEYWIHPGKCTWFETKSGKMVLDTELINRLFALI